MGQPNDSDTSTTSVNSGNHFFFLAAALFSVPFFLPPQFSVLLVAPLFLSALTFHETISTSLNFEILTLQQEIIFLWIVFDVAIIFKQLLEPDKEYGTLYIFFSTFCHIILCFLNNSSFSPFLILFIITSLLNQLIELFDRTTDDGKTFYYVQLVLSILQTTVRAYSFFHFEDLGLSLPSLVILILLSFVDVVGHISSLLYEKTRKNPSKTVLVTGCDTGFGREIALQMANRGWKVFAGCLTEEGISSLKSKNEGVVGLQMDVTKIEDVRRVAKIVGEQLKDTGLGGLINNAGIANGFIPSELLTDNEFRRIFDVNYFGLVAVTREFLPLIRAGNGRIVNISSIASVIHGRNMNPYNSTKAAVSAFSNTLRVELKKWKIPVVEIRPWFMKTMIVDAERNEKNFLTSLAKADQTYIKEYGLEDKSYLWKKTIFLQRNVSSLSSDPQNVIEVLVDSLTKRVPKLRYHVSVPWYVYLIYTTISLTLHDHVNDLLIDWVFGSKIEQIKIQ